MANFEQDRKGWFKLLKKLLKLKYKRPEFIYLGEKVGKNAIILSNHVGSYGPLTMEIHAQFPIRFWGTHRMNSGLKMMYEYQTEVYYHQKHGWNIWAARAFCLIASPLTNLFYKGLRLISTYPDRRFLKTLHESRDAVLGGSNVVIFPENSDTGYHDTLISFYSGFVLLAEMLYRRGIDADIFAAYLKKDERRYIFDKPVKYSKLKKTGADKHEIAKLMLARCNALNEK